MTVFVVYAVSAVEDGFEFTSYQNPTRRHQYKFNIMSNVHKGNNQHFKSPQSYQHKLCTFQCRSMGLDTRYGALAVHSTVNN